MLNKRGVVLNVLILIIDRDYAYYNLYKTYVHIYICLLMSVSYRGRKLNLGDNSLLGINAKVNLPKCGRFWCDRVKVRV